MKPVSVLLLTTLCITGCGGYVILEKRTEVPPRPAPVAPPGSVCRVHEIDRQEAVDIAVAEAVRRHCARLTVHDVDRHKHDWRVELRGFAGHDRETEIRVKVDRCTGEVLSYKCVTEDDDED